MSTLSQQHSTSLSPRAVQSRPKPSPVKQLSLLHASSLSTPSSSMPRSASVSPSSSTSESPSSEASEQTVSLSPSSPSSDPLASSTESSSQPRSSSLHRPNQSFRSYERPRSAPMTKTSSSAPASSMPPTSMEARGVEEKVDTPAEELDPPTSSPRRPRRPGTAMPDRQRQPRSLDSVGGLGVFGMHGRHKTDASSGALAPARDEFEEHFLNRVSIDRDAQLINDVLEGVNFRQLSDDEEVLSEDNNSLSRSSTVPRSSTADRHHLRKNGVLKPNTVTEADDDEFDPEFDTIDLHRSSTVHSDWRHIPTEVGCHDCDGCTRLYAENRRLRRQLDELEFELASNVLHNNDITDDYEPPELVSAIPSSTRFSPSVKKKGRSWTSRLLGSASISLTSSSSKVSEKAMLKSQVQALTVTTEYLWRKLNKAEIELREYRLRDLRARMKMSNGKRSTPTSTERNSRSVDWS